MKPAKGEIKKLINVYWNALESKVRPMPYAKQVLARLKRDYKLVIISDSDGSKEIKMKRLRKLGVVKYFDLIVTGDDVNSTKPDKKFYDFVFRKLKIKQRDCIMVGDKPEFDLKLAKKLGMKTVWLVYGDWAEKEKGKRFGYVDHEIRDLRKLVDIMTE